MSTCNQAVSSNILYNRPGNNYNNPSWGSAPILSRSPQAKGIIKRVTTVSPNNPNSAISHVMNVGLMNGLRLTASIPGNGYLCVKYNSVLVEGGRANDLPGVGYTGISGAYDFSPVVGKNKRRSIYGVSSPSGFTNFISSSLSSV